MHTCGEFRLTTACLFLLTLTVAAHSVSHLPARFNVPNPVRTASLVAFVLSSSLQTWAMMVNPFFAPVIRLQTELGHHLITNGPYTFIRHPGYLAMLIAVPASATVKLGKSLRRTRLACPTPHRFRDTRAVDTLTRGEPL